MSYTQLYIELERLLDNFDNLTKEEIKHELSQLLNLERPCPKCGGACEPITKSGKELNPDARYDAAEAIYTLCPYCKYVYSYEL